MKMLKKKTRSPHFESEKLPHCLFRIPKGGGRVIWEITNTCNYSCRYCIFSSEFKHVPNELSLREVKKTIDQLRPLGFTHIKFTGGEPFIRKDFLEILRYAVSKNFFVDLSTNASLITSEIAEELRGLSLPMVHVSLDGHTKELQELVRGKGSFGSTLRGIQHLVNAGLYVRLGCLIYKGNEDQLDAMVRFATEQKASEIIFSLMEAAGRMRNDISLLAGSKPMALKKKITQLSKTYGHLINVSSSFSEPSKSRACGTCPGGKQFLFIDHLGRVSPCTWVTERMPEYRSTESLHTKNLSGLISSEPVQSFLGVVSGQKSPAKLSCPARQPKLFQQVADTHSLLSSKWKEPLFWKKKYGNIAQLYAFSTENITGYFEHINLTGKTVLCVGSSGDHLINAYLLGAAEVTCFDINRLAEYFISLKLTALRYLDYHEFLEFFLLESPKALDKKIFKRLEKHLPESSKTFWSALLSEVKSGAELRKSALFRSRFEDGERQKRHSPYLKNEAAYRKAVRALKGKELRIITSSLEDLPQKIKGSYDVIMLSNIADGEKHPKAWARRQVTPMKKHLNQRGSLLFAYVYQKEQASKPINAVRNTLSAGPDMVYREVSFPGVIGKSRDAVAILQHQPLLPLL